MVQRPEKRSDVRSAFKAPVLVEDLNAGFVYRARMVNYSKNGIFIETDVGLTPGKEIDIGIENSPYKLSNGTSESHRAKVIWQKSLRNSNFNFGYGVTIISNNDKGNSNNSDFQFKQELRKHPRKFLPKAVFFTANNQCYQGLIYNISRGGVFIKTNDHFTVGQAIKLVIPGTKIDNGIMLTAEVVRCNESGMGVLFKSITENKKAVGVNLTN